MKNFQSLSVKIENSRLFVLDQTQLPHEEAWVESQSAEDMVTLIQKLSVRGAPLIGVAAALALAREVENGASETRIREAAQKLRASRPTAVNLMAAIDRVMGAYDSPARSPKALVATAEQILEEDVELCLAMGKMGAELLHDGDSVLTHCNTGGLATAGIGTALGVIRTASEQGKKIHVYVDETRPLLQGARLTAWELEKLGIPYTLICDNMAGVLMREGKIKKAFVGADRIARNRDVANKIGTYSVAVLMKYHRLPFYVVAPRTTLDERCATGADIPIEERHPDEVRFGKSPRTAPVFNPSFDVTPGELIEKIVLDDRLW